MYMYIRNTKYTYFIISCGIGLVWFFFFFFLACTLLSFFACAVESSGSEELLPEFHPHVTLPRLFIVQTVHMPCATGEGRFLFNFFFYLDF